MALKTIAARMRDFTKHFARDMRGNTAMIFALACVAVIGCGGVGVDLARAMVAKNRMADALDAAALAVGTTQGLTNAQMRDMAQKYFDANYNAVGFGTPGPVQLATDTAGNIALTVSSNVPTSILPIIGIDNVPVGVSNQVTRALTKLRVALVLDNTGSMTQTDSTGTSKISALISATHQLLTTLQNAASHPGDVQVSLIPFSKTVNVGTSNVNATWIDWTDWASAPANAGTSITSSTSTVGPGSSCPWSTSSKGYTCQSGSTNGASTISTIPISGANAGLICPTVDNGNFNSGRLGRYYNGCYNSVPTATGFTTANSGSATNTTVCNSSNKPNGSCTTAHYCSGYPLSSTKTTVSSNVNQHTWTYTTCSCTTGSSATCTRTAQNKIDTDNQWTHTWVANNHSTWTGCIMDRNQNYDTGNSNPSSSSNKFPAENAQSCVPSVMHGSLSYDYTALNNAVNAMTAGGSTNQTVGFVWGWQSLTQGSPLNAPTLDPDTTNVIILLSDGMNTQNRWTGDGSTTNTTIDTRLSAACTAAKAAHVEIYTVLVMAGSSGPLQACASDSSKYFALTTSGAIITTFNQIGQTLANLHLSR